MPPRLSTGFSGGGGWVGGGVLALFVCLFFWRWGERLVVSILFFKKCQKFLRDLHGSQIWTTKN